MKQKVMYTAFVLITIFLLIFINKKDNIKPIAPEGKIPQEVSSEQQGMLTQRSQPILASEGKPRITIIKKSKPAPEIIPSETKKTNTTVRPKKTASSSSSTVASGTKSTQGEASEKPVAGVTRVGKQPTPQKTNELNEQGIIMY